MDTSMIEWSLHWGGIVAALPCFVVGTLYAGGTTFSPIHYTVAKTLGWVFGIPVSLVIGYAVHGALVPSFGDKFGSVFCFGFGWLATWTLVQTTGVEDGPFVHGCGRCFGWLKRKLSGAKQSGAGQKGYSLKNKKDRK